MDRLDTPDAIRQQIWRELGRATVDRHHAWRTPVLATVDATGAPDARTVVLRSADAGQQTLRFFTDQRSPKVAQLQRQPDAALVFWSERLNWQLRAQVTVTVQTAGPQVDAVWQRVRQSASAADYLAPAAPGSPRPSGPAGPVEPSGPHHLAVLTAQVRALDWLELGRGGHRRARVVGATWEWLVP